MSSSLRTNKSHTEKKNYNKTINRTCAEGSNRV